MAQMKITCQVYTQKLRDKKVFYIKEYKIKNTPCLFVFFFNNIE